MSKKITIISLIVAVVLVLLGFKVYKYISNTLKASATTNLIIELSSSIEMLYSNHPVYTSLDTEVAATIAPKSYVIGKTIITPWYSSNKNSIITVMPASNSASFSIITSNIPSMACLNIGEDFLVAHATSVSANDVVVKNISDLKKACNLNSPSKLAINF